MQIKDISKQMSIVYWGYNSFKTHKRGVENVIDFQSKSCDFEYIYYLHYGDANKIYKCGKFIAVSINKTWYWPIFFNYVMYRLKKRKYIFIHSHNPLFSIFSFWKTDLLTVHDSLYYLTNSSNYYFSKIFYLLELFLYTRCRKIHFISNFAKNQSLFSKHKSNFCIIPNTSHFENMILSPFFSSINKKKDEFVILSVRSIEERERIDLLIEVAKKLKDRNFKFLVAGKGPLLDYYRRIIMDEKLTNINLLGYVDDEQLLFLYQQCDIVLILAEYGEGFGLPIIEAYLFNKPVIASDKCAIPEIIISSKYLCKNEVEDIVQKIEICKINPPTDDFKKYYIEYYSNKIVLQKLKEVINDLCK